MGTATAATKGLKKLFGDKKYFDTPKPVSLLKHLIYLANVGDDDIVLDFFGGSGSTGQAVIEFNAEQHLNARYVICQLDEDIDCKHRAYKDGFRTISEICRKRLQLVTEQLQSNVLIDTTTAGFRVFRLDDSNMLDVYYRPSDAKQSDLFSQSDNVKNDRTPEDLLIQVMLSLGSTLDARITQCDVEGKRIFNVSEGYVVACFDQNIDEKVIKAMAQLNPVFSVLRDSCFASDSVRDNAEQIFKTYSAETTFRVI